MTTLSLFVALCGLAYFVFMPRVFDWFSVAYVSACVYMLPVFVGYSAGAYGELPMHFESSLVCVMVFAGIVCGAFILDTYSVRREHQEIPSCWTEDLALAMTILQCVGLLLTFKNSGQSLLATNKQDMLETMSVWTLLWNQGVVAAFVCSFSSRKYRLMVINGFSLLALWYLGFRSSVTFALLGAIVVGVSRRGPMPIIANWKLGAGSLTFAFVVLVYKHIYIFVKAGQWSDVSERLTSNTLISDSILNSEAMSQTHIMNAAITENFRIPFVEHLSDTLIQSFVLGSAKKGDPSYGGRVASDLFPDVSYGIASNIWAEMYSLGEWPLLIAFVIVFVALLYWASRVLRNGDVFALSIVCAWMPHWAFYIHRSDTYRMISFLKQYVMLLLICIPLVYMIRLFISPGRRQGLHIRVPSSSGIRGVVLNRDVTLTGKPRV